MANRERLIRQLEQPEPLGKLSPGHFCYGKLNLELQPDRTEDSKFHRRSINYLLLAALMAAIAGCASPDAAKQIKNFSDAVTVTANNTTQAFKLVEDNHFKEEVSVTVLNYDIKTGYNPDAIKPFMDTNALQVRLDVLNGLKSYAANLSVLMGNSSLTNFDQDTTKLGQALTNVDQALVKASFFNKAPATTQELQIFTVAVNTLGHWLITWKQQKEAEKNIALMQQPVADICQLLQRDFEILRQQLANDYDDTLRNNNQYILNNLSQFDKNPGEKRTEIQEMAALTQEMRNADTTFASMESATVKLAAAHKALGEAFSNNTTNINTLINELITESQRINTYYNSLQSSK